MATLYLTDILKIFNDFEPSRLKIWEIVRTYNYVDFVKFIYLLENVKTERRRPHIMVDGEALYGKRISALIQNQFGNVQGLDTGLQFKRRIDNESPCVNDEFETVSSKINLSLEHTVWRNMDILWAKSTDQQVCEEKALYRTSADALDQIQMLQTHLPGSRNISIHELIENIRLNHVGSDNLLERIVTHNMGTTHYSKFLTTLKYLLFTANQQDSRNDTTDITQSCVTQFIAFYKMIHYQNSHDIDPRGFRFLIMPRLRRVTTRNLHEIYRNQLPNKIIYQPLYQGLNVIVYSSPVETKCYNQYGELQSGLGYSIRSPVNCTFQAIVLPVDSLGNIRSWRYWTYRTTYILYVVDVLRYEQTVLTNQPQAKRLEYIRRICKRSSNNTFLLRIPKEFSSWEAIEKRYIKHRDIYDPIVGVVLRDSTSIINDEPKNVPIEFRFNIMYAYDMYDEQITNLNPDNAQMPSIDYDLGRLFLNYDMSSYKTICLAYGHCDTFIYIMRYDRNIHHFIHCGRLRRLPYEYSNLLYQRSELIYVLNCCIRPMGVLYLRVYYNENYQVLAYDTKPLDGRYKSPYHNEMLLSKIT